MPEKEEKPVRRGGLPFHPARMIWLVMGTVVVWNVVVGKKSTTTTAAAAKTTGKNRGSAVQNKAEEEPVLKPLLRQNSPTLMEIFISSDEKVSPTDSCLRSKQFQFSALQSKTFTENFTVPVSAFQGNATLYLHMILRNMNTAFMQSVTTKPLVKFVRPPKKRVNLLEELQKEVLEDEEDEDEEEEEKCEVDLPKPEPWTPYFQSKVTFSVVYDFDAPVQRSILPGIITDYMEVDDAWPKYSPLIHKNDFWLDRGDFVMLNSSVKDLPDLQLTVEGINLLQFSMYKSYDQQQEIYGKDDTVKQLLQGDRGLLVAVVVASVLHSVFNMLAFKNDVTFWRKQTSAKGQSMTTVLSRLGMMTVVLLYLADHENTSWVVLGNYGLGVAVEAWKAWKLYCIQKSTGVEAKDESLTADKQAAKYLFYSMSPLLVLYAAYSFTYDEHKGAYSFVLSTLVRFIYWFGFAMMTPQLFINYKLKSVAHMPTAALVYKAIGTFIDDLFSFAIEMPTAHRLSCLRDDVIFVILMYQYWIYKVDITRVNEFGQCGLSTMSKDELLMLRQKAKSENVSEESLRNIEVALEHIQKDAGGEEQEAPEFVEEKLEKVSEESESEPSVQSEPEPPSEEEADSETEGDENDDFVKVEHGDAW